MERQMLRRDTEIAVLSDFILQRDPILRFFFSRLKWSPRHVIVFMSLLSGLFFFGVGAVADFLYPGPGSRLEAPANLGFLMFWVFILSPVLWAAYIWQASNVPHLIEKLAAKGILGDLLSDNYRKAVDQTKVILGYMLWRPSYLIALVVIVLFWVTGWLYTWPPQFARQPQYWFEVKWYLPIHLFTHSIGLFILLLFIFRQLVFVIGLYRLFNQVEVKVKPLDPDESGGLGALGDFAKASLWFAIGLGLMAVSYGLFTSAMGFDTFRRLDLIAFYGLYVILVPVCLLAPLYSVRSAMLRARSEVLKPIAQEFEEVLSQASSSLAAANTDLKDLDDKLTQLQRHRELVIDTYPTLPISTRSLRRFSLTALLPLASTILSLVFPLLVR